MNNILFVGNGFDLAHDLLTSYKHFLFAMQNWEALYSMLINVKAGRKVEKENLFYAYTENVSKMEFANLERLGTIIKNNSWVRYFCTCEAEIDGWIDFEKEIIPVIELFEIVLESNCKVFALNENTYAKIPQDILSFQQRRVSRLWNKYFKIEGNSLTVRQPFVSRQYGILKKVLLDSLRNEFDEFIKAFELYLIEFVSKKEHVKTLKQIQEINANFLVSFNYTGTEFIYGIKEENVHHIHGMIRNNPNESLNNMVVGVNERKDQDIKYIFFVKYFQRIQKACGTRYKEFIDRYEHGVSEEYILHIYGHSLDETDEDVLKYVIGEKRVNERLNLKPEKIIIYYYDSFDYEQKVINLIKLYGRDTVEEMLEASKFEFVQTTNETVE